MKKYLQILPLLLLFGFTQIQAQVDVTFSVDLRLLSADDFDSTTDAVSIRGSFNDWGETAMVEDTTEGVYTVTLPLDAGTYYYKFFHSGGGGTWEDSKFTGNDGNREVTVETTELAVGTYYFNEVSPYTGILTTVEFNADMRLPIKQGNIVPGTSNVYVAGSFTDWGTSALAMADDDGDSVYTVVADSILSGDILYYKYVYGDGDAASGTWEDGDNRTVGVADTGNVVSRFWNDENPNITLADGDIIFTVNMSVMEELGLFDPNTDSVQVRGSFNGWSDGDAAISKLNQDFLDPNSWFISIPFDNGVVGSEQFYKYFVTFADTNVGNMWSDGYERPLGQGGGNRDAVFEGMASQEEEVKYYDDVQPAYAILDDGIEITFSVDMTDAANADLQVPTFNPGTDKVYWLSEQPAFTYSQGWEDSDTMKVLELTDENSDMVYEATLTVTAPSWNGFEYRYAFEHEGTFNAEASGFGDFAYRVRYIEQEGYRKFKQPYAAPADSWLGDQEDKSSQSETAPAGDITGVQDLGLVANKFSLEQNYPNPFNPTTTIRFSIPSSDVVTLKIYNVLGQEVKTLINEDMQAGSYEFNFNASNLASGLYVYTLTSGDFVSNKKMMLLK